MPNLNELLSLLYSNGQIEDPNREYYRIQQERESMHTPGIEDPNDAIIRDQARWAKAKYEVESNPWSQALGLIGNSLIHAGINQLSKGLNKGELNKVVGNRIGNFVTNTYNQSGLSSASLGNALFDMINDSQSENVGQIQTPKNIPSVQLQTPKPTPSKTPIKVPASLTHNLGKYYKNRDKEMYTNKAYFKYALGGQIPQNNIPVEIEGEEVLETPDGGLFEAQGPSHEQGGIPIALPESTKVYSKRIKIDGVTMADRKGKREKRSVMLEKLLSTNPTDALLKNSLQRTKANIEKEEQMDLETQGFIGQVLGQHDENLVNTNEKKLQAGTDKQGLTIDVPVSLSENGEIIFSNKMLQILQDRMVKNLKLENAKTIPDKHESEVIGQLENYFLNIVKEGGDLNEIGYDQLDNILKIEYPLEGESGEVVEEKTQQQTQQQDTSEQVNKTVEVSPKQEEIKKDEVKELPLTKYTAEDEAIKGEIGYYLVYDKEYQRSDFNTDEEWKWYQKVSRPYLDTLGSFPYRNLARILVKSEEFANFTEGKNYIIKSKRWSNDLIAQFDIDEIWNSLTYGGKKTSINLNHRIKAPKDFINMRVEDAILLEKTILSFLDSKLGGPVDSDNPNNKFFLEHSVAYHIAPEDMSKYQKYYKIAKDLGVSVEDLLRVDMKKLEDEIAKDYTYIIENEQNSGETNTVKKRLSKIKNTNTNEDANYIKSLQSLIFAYRNSVHNLSDYDYLILEKPAIITKNNPKMGTGFENHVPVQKRDEKGNRNLTFINLDDVPKQVIEEQKEKTPKEQQESVLKNNRNNLADNPNKGSSTDNTQGSTTNSGTQAKTTGNYYPPKAEEKVTTDINPIYLQSMYVNKNLKGRDVDLKSVIPSVPPYFRDFLLFSDDKSVSQKSSNSLNDKNLKLNSGIGYGDFLNLLGDIRNMNDPLLQVLQNRSQDTPNVNTYKDAGKEALDIFNNNKQALMQNRDHALYNNSLETISNQNRLRNTARGVNTLRALDLAQNMYSNKAKSDIYNNYNQQINTLNNTQANTSLRADELRMRGQADKLQHDQEDRDNFNAQLTSALNNKNRGLQTLGKHLNQLRQNNENYNILNDIRRQGQQTNTYTLTAHQLDKLMRGYPLNQEELNNTTTKTKK